MAKLLEETQGKAKRDEFIKSVGGGFKETQGIHVEVINKGTEQKIVINFEINGQKETVELDDKLLKKIIADRAEFEKMVGQNV